MLLHHSRQTLRFRLVTHSETLGHKLKLTFFEKAKDRVSLGIGEKFDSIRQDKNIVLKHRPKSNSECDYNGDDCGGTISGERMDDKGETLKRWKESDTRRHGFTAKP